MVALRVDLSKADLVCCRKTDGQGEVWEVWEPSESGEWVRVEDVCVVAAKKEGMKKPVKGGSIPWGMISG